MNIPSTDSTPLNVRPAALWEFRIDVGGTFTDCIGVSPNGLWREFKVLSSGLTRGTPESSRHDCLTDSRRRRDPQDFWVGAVCRLRGPDGSLLRECRVAGFDNASGTLQLDHVIADVDSFTYELDCGLPAPVLAIRWLLELRPDATCPPVRLRFGTTRGTNALL
ncbi:MAG: hypothetical protein KDA81_20995, partial [Planctomycetaceae bacterium]|nr:hypothetical protein [Planctomycetaceae bacterium]